MKTVVIYKSKTGFAKKYAQWISEELSADIFEVSSFNLNSLSSYDIVIYGGSLYAVGINGLKNITENLEKLKDKKLIVYATGMSPWKEETISEIKNKNFTLDQQEYIKFFYLRGGFDFSKLSFFDKMLMRLLKYKIQSKNKEDLTSDEKGMLASYDKPVDFTDKKNIQQIVTYVKSQEVK